MSAENSISVISILTDNRPSKERLIENARSAQLEYQELLGDGKAKAEYGLDIAKNGVSGSVRILVSASLMCDSSPTTHIAAMEHVKNLVFAETASEYDKLKQLFAAVQEEGS